jgi:hypothetical protein
MGHRGICQHLALSQAQALRSRRVRVVLARDEETLAVCVDVLDERPTTRHEALPRVERIIRALLAQVAARSVHVKNSKR